MALRYDGVDLSHYQSGALDFEQAKAAGLRFVVHKATEGAYTTDALYDRRRRSVAYHRLPFGAYHFARPGVGDAVAEADHFLKWASPREGDLFPTLDLEDAGGLGRSALTRWAGQWIARVRATTNSPVIVYTPFDLDDDFGCPLWVARYSNDNLPPRVPAPWTDYTIWQFTNGKFGYPRACPGIGAVDLDYLNTNNPDRLLPLLLIGGPPEEPMPTVPEIVAGLMKHDLGGLTVAQALRRSAKSEAALAAILARLPAEPTAPLTVAEVTEAVKAGLREVLGSLDQ